MKRVLTATCLAAVCAVGLAAQQTTTGQSPTTTSGQRGGGPRTVIGCLRGGDTADSYMLTDIQMSGRPGDSTGATAGSTAVGTGSTTAGSTGGATGSTAGGGPGRGQMPTTMMLSPSADVDLKPHVGHKIEVTGTMSGGGRRGGDMTGSTTGGAATTTPPPPPPPPATTGQTAGAPRAPRTLTVTSIRMISESCS